MVKTYEIIVNENKKKKKDDEPREDWRLKE